jgi:hypothetical protein
MNITSIKNSANFDRDIIKTLTNKVLELVMIELNKHDMRILIKDKIVHPLLYLIYCQLYPYIYTIVIIILLMFVILIVLLVFFIIYLKK